MLMKYIGLLFIGFYLTVVQLLCNITLQVLNFFLTTQDKKIKSCCQICFICGLFESFRTKFNF